MKILHKDWRSIDYIQLRKTDTPVLIKVLVYEEHPLSKENVKELSDLTFDSFNFKKHKEGYFTADGFILSDGRVLTDVSATPGKDLVIATSFTEESEEQEND